MLLYHYEKKEILEEAYFKDKLPLEDRGIHGEIIAIKDLQTQKVSNHTRLPIFAKDVASKDDLVVARIRAAGAIIIGKTNTPEFGLVVTLLTQYLELLKILIT